MTVTQSLLLSSFFLFCLLLLETESVIPIPCQRNLTGVCCPDNCGGRTRGVCRRVRPVSDRRAVPDNYPRADDRLRWPRKIFSHLCQCRLRFSGVACERCRPGRTGPNCRGRTRRIRRNLLQLTATQLDEFHRVMNASLTFKASQLIFDDRFPQFLDPLNSSARLKHPSVQEYVVYVHRLSSRPVLERKAAGGRACQRTEELDMNHLGPGFLSWHRWFMFIWEEELIRVAEDILIYNFTIPYWDWTDARGCAVCNNRYFGASDSNGRITSSSSVYSKFVEWCPYDQNCPTGCVVGDLSYIRRNLTRIFNTRLRFPTSSDVRGILRLRSFCSRYGDYQTSFGRCRDFARALEGLCFVRQEFNADNFDAPVQTYMHNRVHQIFTGSFSDTVTSPNDVLFIVHHTNVDRLFEKWLRRRIGGRRRRRRTRVTNRRLALLQYWRRLGHPARRMNLIGHCARCYAVGFIPIIRNIHLLSDIRRSFGYEYDSYRFGSVP